MWRVVPCFGWLVAGVVVGLVGAVAGLWGLFRLVVVGDGLVAVVVVLLGVVVGRWMGSGVCRPVVLGGGLVGGVGVVAGW
ncbi:hypothetical protein [Amycolatopsis saalfeldensis]|uniref:hypothetical protein n=1 Tax=Amycolatopsis saalfeldensis TaxID=394193 RepID=UPI001160C6B7|nr:hypothetical protein [Amycolatopsis saalfeldensis]